MATNEKYTMRTFLTAVKDGNVTDVEKAYAEAEIAKLDKRNEDRKGKESATAKANAPLKEKILEYVKGNPGATAKAIGVALELTTAKVSALATQLVDGGALVAEEVKNPDGKGKVKGYTAA